MSNIRVLTTEEVIRLLEKEHISIIDIRSADAYNGWKEGREKRGGHIKNARSMPYKWSNYIDWFEIVQSKNIVPENTIVVYGGHRESIDTVAELFVRAGFDDICVYYRFEDEWTVNPELPIESLCNYRNLVSPLWLKELIETGNAPEYENDSFVLLHCHYRNREDYLRGHIPGAIEADTNLFESEETWNRRQPAELKDTMEGLGITHDTTVIVYGRFSSPDNSDPFPGSSAGHIGAMRCAFILMYAGVKDVRVLNGGLQSWTDEGNTVTGSVSEKNPAADFGLTIPGCPYYAVDIDEAKEILRSDDKNLVCVRSWPEYIGEVSGYNYIAPKGRIPGAVFVDCGSDAYHMENFRNPDHTMREYHEIDKMLRKAGISPDCRNAFYCGTGWRGSEAFLNAWLLGWRDVAVFDGGWYEWSNDDSNPIETGVPANITAVKSFKMGG